MIEILDTITFSDPITNEPMSRSVYIAITQAGQTLEWSVGGLPLVGNLQTILDARESELWRAAQERGKPHNLFSARQEKIIKAFALVVMDEINILRNAAALTPRNQTQIETAIRNKLKSLT